MVHHSPDLASELRDQLRDRRTLFMIAVLPLLLYPVLGFAVLQFALGLADRKIVVGIPLPSVKRPGATFRTAQTRKGRRSRNILFCCTMANPPTSQQGIAANAAKARISFLQCQRPARKSSRTKASTSFSASSRISSHDWIGAKANAERQARITIQSRLGQDRLRPGQGPARSLARILEKSELNSARLERHRLPANFDEPFRGS